MTRPKVGVKQDLMASQSWSRTDRTGPSALPALGLHFGTPITRGPCRIISATARKIAEIAIRWRLRSFAPGTGRCTIASRHIEHRWGFVVTDRRERSPVDVSAALSDQFIFPSVSSASPSKCYASLICDFASRIRSFDHDQRSPA